MAIIRELRQAVAACKLPGSELAKAAGISQPAVSRFLREQNISLAAADKLAEYFGLELQPKKEQPKKPEPPKKKVRASDLISSRKLDTSETMGKFKLLDPKSVRPAEPKKKPAR
jgi:transcriptional regulator with XRE-family HTH domain